MMPLWKSVGVWLSAPQDGWGWQGSTEVVLFNLLVQAGTPRAGCSSGFWASPREETRASLGTFCQCSVSIATKDVGFFEIELQRSPFKLCDCGWVFDEGCKLKQTKHHNNKNFWGFAYCWDAVCVSVLLKLRTVGILLFSLPTWCFSFIQFFLWSVSQMFLVLMLISFPRMEQETLLALLAKGLPNSGRMQPGLVRCRSSGQHTSQNTCIPPAPFFSRWDVRADPAGAGCSVCSHVWMRSSSRPLSDWKPKSQRRFSGEQTKYVFIVMCS